MKYIKQCLFAGLLIFIFTINIDAKCNDKFLTDAANELEVVFEIPDVEDDEASYILNIRPSDRMFYLKVYDSLSDDTKEYDFEEGSMDFKIKSLVHFEPKKYVIDVIGNLEASCYGEIIRTIEYTVPPYNFYSVREECRLNSEQDICKPYNDTSKVTEEDFLKEIENVEEQNEEKYKEINKTLLDRILEYVLYALIPVAIVAIIYGVRIYILKKKKEDK